MNILVLGGHGFIGSHIVEALSQEGHSLRVFSRNSTDFMYDAEYFPGDFLDKVKLSEALTGMDAVVHSISTTTPLSSASNPVYDIKSNLLGTIDLLQLMKSKNIYRLIYLSSGGTVYGNPTYAPVTEDSPLNPICNYAAVKIAIENFINISMFNKDLQAVILRPSNLFGERQHCRNGQGLISTLLYNVINDTPAKIFGDGEMIRDYLYVKDLAKLVCNVLASKRCGTYNVGSGMGYSINEIISIIEKATTLRINREYLPSRPFDVHEIVLDSSRATNHFNWRAEGTLPVGIKKQFDWLKKHL